MKVRTSFCEGYSRRDSGNQLYRHDRMRVDRDLLTIFMDHAYHAYRESYNLRNQLVLIQPSQQAYVRSFALNSGVTDVMLNNLHNHNNVC